MLRPSLLLCVLAVCLDGIAEDGTTSIPTGKQKPAFEIAEYRQFIDHDLGRPRPACTMAQMGVVGRRIEGQLVNFAGAPIPAVLVALVEPIGYSGHCYYDNFDYTDEQGRFVVAGGFEKTRMIFRQTDGRIWKHTLADADRTIRVRWPKPATVHLQLPPDVVAPDDDVTIASHGYWAGTSVMRQTTKASHRSEAWFRRVIPGDYYVTVYKSVNVGDEVMELPIEIGSFTCTEGEDIDLDCREQLTTTIHGKFPVNARVAQNPMPVYVIIQRCRENYEHQPPAGDLLIPEKDGSFRSRKLPWGNYLVELIMKPPARGGLVIPKDQVLATRRVVIDGSVASVDLASIADVSVVSDAVITVLREAATTTQQRTYYANKLKEMDARAGAESVMLRMLTDPKITYPWRRVIPEILQGMTDSPRAVKGMLAALPNPVDQREQGNVIRALQTAPARINEVVSALQPYCEDANHITRGITIRTLGQLAVAHEDHRERIGNLLVKGLDDRIATTRSTAADFLGRITFAEALPALKAAAQDPDGRVAAVAAFSVWKISNDPRDFYPVVTEVLQRPGVMGHWQAAYFTRTVAKEHTVPQDTRQALESVAVFASKPPFRSSFEYEKSRAGRAAKQVLDEYVR